ncbi:thiolase family protein [Chloroflexota bacterium]
MREVSIIGVGIHKFGRFEDEPYTKFGIDATKMALRDANLEWKDMQVAYCARMYLPSTTGVKTLTQLGRTGISITDVESACASGGSALGLAYLSVASGVYDFALALGVEKMPRGFMDPKELYEDWQIKTGLSQNPMYWALKARRHMAEYGTTIEQIGKVAVKNHKNSVYNPYAMYQKEFSLEEILNSRIVNDPITLLMICAPNEGAAAAVLCPKDIAHKYNTKPIDIAATVHTVAKYGCDFRVPARSISAKTFPDHVIKTTAGKAYEQASLGPEDIDVAEVQDTDAFCEIECCENLGFCEEGEGGRLIDEGATEVGGRIPVNTSGGLICKGEPVGASHLGQVFQIVKQLRGEAGPMQVADAKVGLAQVLGAGGNCAATILKR